MCLKIDIESLPTLKQAIINNTPLNSKILLKCEKCGFEYIMKYSTIKNRKIKPNEAICNHCLKNMGYDISVCKQPWWLEQYGKEPIPWSMYLKYKDVYNKGCKNWIKIRCSECNQDKLVQWRKIVNRKYANDLQICSDCINKYSANLDEKRKINSEAQKIAQNRPEVKEKMRNSIVNKIKTDPVFRDKITRYSPKLSGYYKGIKFQSSWELSLIHYYGDKLKPCPITIDYTYKGKNHLYLPDFELYEDGKKYLIEVKGEYRETDYIKINTAKKLIKENKLKYDGMKIIDKSNIKLLKNIKIINNIELLKQLDQEDLIIKNYPKNWKKKV